MSVIKEIALTEPLVDVVEGKVRKSKRNETKRNGTGWNIAKQSPCASRVGGETTIMSVDGIP